MRFIALLAFALASASAAAQDLPGRVGRVSYADGPVAVYQDPDIGWEKAYVNSPLTSQNSLWTEPGARAELRVSAVAIRLDGATQLDVSRLDDDRMDAALVRGSVAIRIRHNDYASRFVFDTPEARFTLTREGRYRIDVDTEAQQTRLAVFDGEASMETSEGVRRIPRGRMVVIAEGNFAFDQVYRTDFDAWTVARDRDWVERRSTRYVSTFMTGYEELDPYGEWIEEPGYGALWVPTQVATDWVPYRFGHWSYVRPWGWTWIDDQPWGYAPFHYGRWVHVRERWCWYPGRREARPAWAPALVAWVGGSNFSVAVGGGGPVMGWYPLAPTERYQPWYQANDRYVSRVNNIVINNITINNDNRRFGGEDRRPPQEVNRALAVTAVPRENLIERRPVQQSMVRVATDVARNAPVVQPQNVVPNNTEIQRMRAARSRTAPPSIAAAQQAAPSMPQAAPQGQPAARGNAAIGRGERAAAQPGLPFTAPQVAPGAPVAPAVHPNFARPERGPVVRGQAQSAPAPAPAPAAPQAAPQPAPQGNPLSRSRGEQAQQERAQQQEAQRQAQEQRRAAEAQQREAQRQQQQQQQREQQPQQREQQPAPQGNPLSRSRGEQVQQERAQQEAQRQAQEQRRAAEAQQQQQREAQRQQQEQQRRAAEAQQQQQREAQQQQQREAQQQQQREAQRQQQLQQREAQRQQQQEAQRQAQEQRRAAEAQQREAQRQQQLQQQAQQRQQQEAQRQQREQQAQAQRQQAAPQPQPQGGNPLARGGEEHRGRPHGQEDNDDNRGGARR